MKSGSPLTLLSRSHYASHTRSTFLSESARDERETNICDRCESAIQRYIHPYLSRYRLTVRVQKRVLRSGRRSWREYSPLFIQERIFSSFFPPRRAKISHFIPFKYNDVFVCSAMEIDEVDDDDVDYNLSPDASGNDICNIGGSGDEGGKDELLLKLQQYVTSDANFTR